MAAKTKEQGNFPTSAGILFGLGHMVTSAGPFPGIPLP